MITVLVLLCPDPFLLSSHARWLLTHFLVLPCLAAVCLQLLPVLPVMCVLKSTWKCASSCHSSAFHTCTFPSYSINTSLNIPVTKPLYKKRGKSVVSGTCLNLCSFCSAVCFFLSLQSIWVTTSRQCWTETWQKTYPESCTQMIT